MQAKSLQSLFRQSVYSRLPKLALFRRRAGRHAKVIHISNRTLRLSISFRQFNTNPVTRTKLQKQYVLPGAFAVREIAITINRYQSPFFIPKIQIPNRAGVFPASFATLGIAGILFFSLNLTSQKHLVPVAHSLSPRIAQTPKSAKTLPASPPARLHINKINLDTAITPVGKATDGSLEVPGPDQVGWYTGSPTPGELGPAVIDGHVDYIDSIAVFWRLRELTPGDIIQVNRADGSTATFKVDSVEEFPQDSFPTDKVYGNVNYAGLRLITCGGVFNPATHHYSDNTVVFASLSL